MEQRSFTKNLRLLITTAIFMFVGQSLLAYDIVTYALTSNLTSTSADIPANRSKSFSTTSTGTISYGGSILQNSGWNVSGKYWQTAAFSTFGYHTIGVSAVMKSDNNTGPKDFRLDYSLDGGSSWSVSAVAIYSITAASGTAYTAALPQACQNQASVMLRWTNYTSIAVNKVASGTVTSGGKSYISTVSVTGYLPSVPATQAHDISIVSRTPTTITVGWTKGGNNDSVVVMMNTTNSFSPVPVDDQSFNAMSGTYSSGRQIIYVGTKSKFTVNVTSATDQYYFRVFDFIPNNGMYRYITTSSDPGNGGVVKNPVLCALETITIDPATFWLTRASMGATITPTKKSAISERAIYWDINPGVTELTGNKLSDNVDADQGFSFIDVVGRGQTIYYVASVTNASGTIWSSEASFNNTPIFSGTGIWDNAARWNVQEVPGSHGDATYGDVADSPIINGTCTQTVSHDVTDLTINAGKSLQINAAIEMNVTGTLTNDAGVSGILIKSSSSAANGSLQFANGSPSATVEMYSKANWNLSNAVNNKYKWQFFGIPVKTITAGNTFNLSNSYVREWDESSIGFFDAWVLAGDGSTSLYKNAGSTLDQNHGYELVQQNPTTYTFTGELLDTDFTQSLPYTSGVAFAGQHIFGNPFTAAIHIADIQFGLTNTEKAVYLYNTGTYSDWSNANGSSAPGNGPGQYTVSTPLTAGSGSVPSQIPTSGSFLVKSFGGTGTITIPKAGGLVANTDQQRIKRQSTSSTKVNTRIDLIGQKFSDRMWIFTDASCTRNFDNGWDGRKILGSSQVSQLYSIENDGNYQINAVNDMNESYIGFQAGEDTQFKMVFNHENTDKVYGKIYLVDLLANKSIDITQNGTEYAFTATANDAIKRFKIVTQTTGTLNPTENSSKLKMFNTNETIYIQNFTDKSANYTLFNESGKAVQTIIIDSNSIKTINTKGLNSGIYIAKSETDTEKVTLRLIIR